MTEKGFVGWAFMGSFFFAHFLPFLPSKEKGEMEGNPHTFSCHVMLTTLGMLARDPIWLPLIIKEGFHAF